MNPILQKYSNYNYKSQHFLLINLYLLDLIPSQDPKINLQEGFLNKDNPKAVFYILYHSIIKMVTPQQSKAFQTWYPPRTVADQIQFKKVCVSLIQKLQIYGKVPKNFMLSKTVIDQYYGERIIQFLRYITQFALRSVYLIEYTQPLIQISPFGKLPTKQNQNIQDINRFYPFLLSPEVPDVDQQIFEILQSHLQLTRKSLLQKSLNDQPIIFPQQQLINSVFYLQQMKKKLATKVPKQFFSQNRAFDRTQILDKTRTLWKQLDIQLQPLQQINNSQILQSQQKWIQVDVQWQKWLRKQSNTMKDWQMSQIQLPINKQKQKLQNIKKILSNEVDDLQKWSIDIKKKINGTSK